MALTPQEWLDRLTRAMDNRRTRLELLRRYMDGNAPLPEGAEGVREAYQAFQKKARLNLGELVVDSVVERMIPSGFTVGGELKDDDDVRAIWKRDHLAIGVSDVLRDMIGLSAGYTIVGEEPGTARRALVTCERPEQVITEQAPNRPDQVRAGLKVYRDEVDGFDIAYLHVPGGVQTYFRELTTATTAMNRSQGGWTAAGDMQDTGLDFVPIFPWLNRGGLGEFETHTDLLDRINWSILQRLVINAMQAYRQRATTGDLPDNDADGNEIDYAQMFSPSPGALWQLPEGVTLWESQTTDISNVLLASKDDFTHLAAVTRTPMSTMMPGGENQTAEGAAFAKEGLVFKTQDRIERAKAALGLTMGAALAIERGERKIIDVESLWKPAERQSLQERADAATKAADLPWRKRMTSIWGFSDDEVDAMESQRAADALLEGVLAAAAAPPAAPAPGSDVRPA